MSAYLCRIDHADENKNEVQQLVVMYAQNVGDRLLKAMMLLSLWDEYNCFITHSNNNGLSHDECYREFQNGFIGYSEESTLDVPHQNKEIEVYKIKEMKDSEMNFAELIDSFLSDCSYQSEDIIKRLHDFLQANNVTDEVLKHHPIENQDIQMIVEFLVNKKSSNQEYSDEWVAELDSLLKENT